MKYNNMIIDGNNFLFRAYHTTYGDRNAKNVLQQFFKMLKTVATRFEPDETYFTWDNKLNQGGHNFRNDLADYKGQRKESEEIAFILSLHDPIQEILDSMGVQTVYPFNLEADDVICFLSKQGGRNIVISQDKDLLQLVSDNTDVLLASQNLLVNVQNFEMNAGSSRENFVLYKSIMGDVSDNIKGLVGYGPVKSKKLAEELRHKNIFCQADDMDRYLTADQWTIIENNMKMVDLSYAVDTYPEETAVYEEQMKNRKIFDSAVLRELFERRELTNCIRSFGEFNRLFNKNQLTSTEFDINSVLDYITL